MYFNMTHATVPTTTSPPISCYLDTRVQKADSHADCAKTKTKTYNRRDSQMVTHSSTSRPVQCLCMAERTGCPVFTDLWSYVLVFSNALKIYSVKPPWSDPLSGIFLSLIAHLLERSNTSPFLLVTVIKDQRLVFWVGDELRHLTAATSQPCSMWDIRNHSLVLSVGGQG